MAIILLFVLGTILGSFAGALIWRIKHGRDFLHERSECEKCHHTLGLADLIPVLSWLMLKGRCRYCKKRITPSHLYIELITGTLFVGSYLWWPTDLLGAAHQITFGFWLAYLTGMVVLFVYDMRWRLLPDVIIFPLIVLATSELLVVRVWLLHGGLPAVLDAVGGVVVIAGFFGLLYAVSKGRWIGFGDVKLGIFMGVALGLPGAFFALVGSYYVALFVIFPLLAAGKVKRQSHVAFGPFLLTSFVLSYFFTDALGRWFHVIF